MSIKNTRNILIKNIGDACIGAVCWWLVGHGIAFGEDWGKYSSLCVPCVLCFWCVLSVVFLSKKLY